MDGKLRNMTSLYIVGEGKILCLFREGSRVANNKYIGSCGGHFESWELNDARACILREMEEELGLSESDVLGLQLRYITQRFKNGEIRQNDYFFARLCKDIALSSNEGTLQWVPYEEMAELDMPVSAKHMILHYLKTGQYDHQLYAGVTQINGTVFVPMVEFEG